jgi:transcriptional regulator with XRE-family HTH domain
MIDTDYSTEGVNTMWDDTVKAWLARYGLSQAWLARRTGYSEHHLSRCLLGKVKPSDDMLTDLAKEMNQRQDSSDAPIVLQQRPIPEVTPETEVHGG